MKKLKLKLEGKQQLTKDQLKKIGGGYNECNDTNACNETGAMHYTCKITWINSPYYNTGYCPGDVVYCCATIGDCSDRNPDYFNCTWLGY